MSYPKYIDKGLLWISKIPDHWDVKKMKYCFDERSEKGHPDEPVLCATQSRGVIPQSMYEGRVVVVNKGFENLKFVCVGDFVISLRSFQGGLEYAYYQGIISAAYTILSIKDPKQREYYKYLFKSKPFIKLLETCVTGIREGQNINYSVLRDKLLPIPPLEEQEKIVEYIDAKSNKIKSYISERERELKILSELKQSQIAEVVTRGLNPDAPLKDSGVPWIGMIPEHWEMKRLSQVAYEHYISNKSVHHQNLLSLSYGNIVRKDINTTEGLLPASFDDYQIVEPGNIILRLTDLQNDHKSLRVGLVKEEGIITSAYVCLGIINEAKILPAYLYNLLHTYDIMKLFYSMGGGIRQGLNWQGLKKLDVVLPLIDEQRAIVESINSKCNHIDTMIANIESEIAYLKEYKQRLIADAVTGAINVQ